MEIYLTPSTSIAKKRRIRPDNLWLFIMLLPAIVLFLAVSLYPFIWAIRYIFYSYDGFTKEYFVGFDNLIRIFTRDSLYWKSVLQTFEYATKKLFFILPLSLIVSVFLNKKISGRHIFRVTFFIPTVISGAVASLIFYFIFSPYNGILNNMLQAIGLVNHPIDWLGDLRKVMGSIVIVAVWAGFGNYMILFLAGLQSIPDETYESSKMDGANAIQEFFYITIPMLGPVMKIVLMLALVNALRDYQSIMVLTNGAPLGRSEVMLLYVYKLLFGNESQMQGTSLQIQYGYGATAGFISSIIIGILTLIYLKFSKKMDEI
ncbi:MAG: carbohydrate ABC transporter permease [Bacteroidota bacterium]